jgi:hypothetical protein
MALAFNQHDRAMRLQSAGSGKGLVVKVVAALEQGLAAYKRDRHSFDPDSLQYLEPDLDVLIKIAEGMVESLKSRSAKYNDMVTKTILAIGDCNSAMRVVQKHLSDVNSQLEEERVTEELDLRKVREVQEAINENNKKISELQDHIEDLKKWFWVPGYNYYLMGQALNDLCTKKRATLEERLQQESSELQSTAERLRQHRSLRDELTGETNVLQCKIHALEESKKGFDQTKKIYDARIATIYDVIVYYRLLHDAVKNIKDNLDLPKVIEKLDNPRKLVSHTGDVRQGTLKDALIQLGDDYDQYDEREGEVAGGEVGIFTFQLLGIHEPMDDGKYRLATMQDVKDHRDALLVTMPKWEIANLADGSVDGALYGGNVSPRIRSDVSQKLAVKTPEHLTFKLLGINDPIEYPVYRLATVDEVTANKNELFKAMPSWEIANLQDGSVSGWLYGGAVSPRIRNDVGHKLGVKV